MKTKAQILQEFEDKVMPLINSDMDEEENEAGEIGRVNLEEIISKRLADYLSSSLDSAIEAVRVEKIPEQGWPFDTSFGSGHNSCVSLQDEKIKRFNE